MSESRASRPAGLTADELPGYRPALLRYATLQVRETAVAEDLVQNTLVAALQSLDSFRGDASPTTWLIGILKRQIIAHYRRMTREIGEMSVERRSPRLCGGRSRRGPRSGCAAGRWP